VIQALPRIAGTNADQAARVEHGEARGEAGSCCGTVEPPRRHDDGIPAHVADSLPRLGDLDDADACDLGVLRMDARELVPRRSSDPLAGQREVAGFIRFDREAELLGVRNRVPHAAVGDVDRNRADPVDLERRIQPVGEARDVGELDALDAAVAACRACLDHPAGRLQPHDRLRLAHLHHPGLEQDGRRADRVRAGHGRILGRLHDDEPGIAVGAGGRHDQVRVASDAAARLAEEQLAQRVALAPQRLHLLEDGRAPRRQDAADDDVPDLAAGVAADDGDHPPGAHGPTLTAVNRRVARAAS
jgi:hypothetical protein